MPAIEHDMLRSLFRALAPGQVHGLDAFPEDAVAILARHHRLSALLGAIRPDGISATLAERFRQDHVATLSRNTWLRQHLVDCVRLLAGHGIDAIVLKGLVYDERLYPRPGSQPTSDIDLLVHPRDRRTSFEALAAAGWSPVEGPPGFDETSYYEVVWQKNDVRLDLHLALTSAERCAIDYGELWSQKAGFPLGDLNAWRLADAHAVVHHVLHMAIHHFDGPAVDLVALTRMVTTEDDFAAAETAAHRWGCVRPWRTSVRLAAYFLPWWPVASAVDRLPPDAWSAIIIDGFGPVGQLTHAQQLRRSFAHFDSATNVVRYVLAQARRKARAAALRRLSTRSPAERLGVITPRGSQLMPARGRVALPLDALWLGAIIVAALAMRIYLPWSQVYLPTHLNLLDTDAWYHLRAIEHLVAQFPHRLALDPYAAPDGMQVPIAPLFDWLVATAAWIAGLGRPSPELIARIATLTPPVLAAATTVIVYAAAKAHSGRFAGLLAAALVAILPGPFLDRTRLGFVDHHALEALLSVGVLFFALTSAGKRARPRTIVAFGAVLAAYLFTWNSAAFLFAILAAWLALHGALQSWRRLDLGDTGRIVGGAAAIALLAAVLSRPFGPDQFLVKLAAVLALLIVAAAIEGARQGVLAGRWSPRAVAATAAVGLIVAGAVFVFGFPDLAGSLTDSLIRFGPSERRMQVLEARPLLLYDGTLSWRPTWEIYRSGFAAGLVAIIFLAARWIRSGSPGDLLLVVWTASMYAATLGQNRFGYYLVPAVAVAAGSVAARIIAAGQRAGGWRETASAIGIAVLLFGPTIVPSIRSAGRPGALPPEWVPAFEWLRRDTPEPFGDPDYYYARYDTGAAQRASYSVMTWWDYGYWILQAAHRVPVANPTQAGARAAGRFFLEVDEQQARTMLDQERARYVLVDEALPFKSVTPAEITEKFSTLVAWAGVEPGRFFDGFLLPDGSGYRPVLMFHPDYYRTMIFRLAVLGGAGTIAAAPATVIPWTPKTVAGFDGTVRVITALHEFEGYDMALAHVRKLGPGPHLIVGQDPRRSPIPLEPVSGLARVYRTPAPGAFHQGAVQVFEVSRP